jgi:hypothetical protein
MLTRALISAAASLLLAAPALAASTATLQFTNVNVLLIDLDTGDGITPSVSFASGVSRGEVTYSFVRPGSGGNESATFTGLFGAWSPGSASVTGDFGSAAASLSGSGMPSGSSLSASGTATAPGDGFCLPGSGGFNSCFTTRASYSASVDPADFSSSFTLSPNTLMVFTVEANIAVAATGGGRIAQSDSFLSTNSDTTSANASLSVSGAGPTGSGFQSSNDNRSLFANAFFDFGSGVFIPASDSFSGQLGVSFTNLSSGDLTGNFSMNFRVSGTAYGDALLVPEPSAWALMLAGLATVAGVARRRRA